MPDATADHSMEAQDMLALTAISKRLFTPSMPAP